MSTSCVIFSCTIVHESRVYVLQKFLNAFKERFSDTDIFIGINPVSLPNIEDIISSFGLNIIFMERVSDSLYSESDASAYQTALSGLRQSGNTYDKYWFVHTKSGVNPHSDYLADWYIHNFLANKQPIETLIDSNPGIGSYGMLGIEYNADVEYNETDCEIDLFKNTLTDQLPCTHANFFYIHGIYVIDSHPMNIFLNSISDIWFTTKLDRYYFEGVFPFIVSRAGYFPYLENRYSCNANDLHLNIDAWISSNNLEIYKKYSNIFKTSYIFHQLYPPPYLC
jgi:hypothetical protein